MMVELNTIESPPFGQKIKIIALLEPDAGTLNAAPAPVDGFVVEATDSITLFHALRNLCSGVKPASGKAKRVRVTVHEASTGAGEHHLSPREQDVLCGLVRGLSYKMIAHELDISFETVRTHIKGIYLKLNVNNNTAAVVRAIQSGLTAA